MHGKISPSMYSGSMVGAGAMAFALMPYCIANARPDEGCCVDLNPQLLASIFGEPKEKVEVAIAYLCAPDPHSRSTESDGRRLLLVGPGPFRFKVVNLQKYRDDASADERREYWRQHKAWERSGKPGEFKFEMATGRLAVGSRKIAAHAQNVDNVWTNTQCPQPVHTTDTTAEAVADTDTPLSCLTAEQIKPGAKREIELFSGSSAKDLGKGNGNTANGEAEFLQLFGEALNQFNPTQARKELANWGGRWRNRFREDPGKANRVLAELSSMVKEGRVSRNAGAAADNLWKSFA